MRSTGDVAKPRAANAIVGQENETHIGIDTGAGSANRRECRGQHNFYEGRPFLGSAARKMECGVSRSEQGSI
jgi:hypothetical protein